MVSLHKVLRKVRSNFQIYHSEFHEKGLSYVISARLKKFSLTRSLYYLFTPNKIRTNNGLLMFIDKQDTVVSEVLLQKASWEPFSTKVFLSQLSKGAGVIDLGAHIGYYTLLAANTVGNTGIVYAFEPDPRNFSLLTMNVSINKFSHVVTENIAVGEKNGFVQLYQEEHNLGDHRIYDSTDNRKSIAVKITKLDSYFSKINPEITVLKMDIQGAEHQALQGMKTLIKNNKNLKIITEFWPEGLEAAGSNAKKFLTELQSLGFTFQIIDEEAKQLRKTSTQILLDSIAEGTLYDTNLLCIRTNR